MALIIVGRIVPFSSQPGAAASFKGKVFVRDDGTIAAVSKSRVKSPPGFGTAAVVDVGDALVLPGFIDLHSHLAYATLPLWTQPGRTVPYAHHDSWPGESTYASSNTWPAYAFITACPAELLAYAEVRALIGGTTSIQGSPPSNRPLDGWLVRNVEDERLGRTIPATRVLASTLTLKPDQLGARATQMRTGSAFIYHCAEGQVGSIVSREYTALRLAGCLQHQLVAIHTNALPAADYQSWNDAGTVVWSPFSNLWLYGSTTNVPAARQKQRVCIGSDWGPSGTRNVLAELKVAHLVSEANGWNLTPEDLVGMITCNPGDALKTAWGKTVGRLEVDALADIVVVASRAGGNPFETVLAATEADVQLVVVNGKALYGTTSLMQASGASDARKIKVGAHVRRLAMRRFADSSDPWTFDEVLTRMEEVRAAPKAEIEKGHARARASAVAGEPPALRLALDMPTGRAPVGGLPKDLGTIVVPPIQPIHHDAAFFASITNRGFHGGLLDGLKNFYI
jgi:5-methylthioadenosine/S-adenosylhomocysteine deaminase